MRLKFPSVFMNALEKLNRILTGVLAIFAGVSVIALMLLAAGNVIMRLFGFPYSGTYEMVGFLGAIVAAFALGYTQVKKEHVMVDLFSRKYPPLLKRFVDAASYLLVMAFSSLAAYAIFESGRVLKRKEEVSETLKIIYYPFVYAVALGFAVMAISLLIDFLGTIFRGEGEDSS
ncbi:MAG TPA: TRAP transporter small permease [Candidatus Sumerlaeota bacterium]|nr:TRAP transporter small permease [Candidatus Sumerlaeota bacterium]HRR32376.1 TRAP transporter small permease [Candidatus Sumerlaeia bacterium]HON49227.1 TRAP transporter small permease [Candidatus Sumerlaeota bacterium]HOR64166.1 TRAP transporter small permease [Candidatus Sumerlaeota bacterium]HQH10983.1 TRAP transporter small permease [Candidatus Sumerlaeota bacterium]